MVNLSAEEESLRCLVLTIVRAIVKQSDAVRIDIYAEEGRLIFELHVDPSDLATVIGKRGRMAHSLRNLAYAVSRKRNCEYYLDIFEPGRISLVEPGTNRWNRYTVKANDDGETD